MSSTTAFQCDGPACDVLTTRAPGTQYPASWARLTIRTPGGLAKVGAFHGPGCAIKWVTREMSGTDSQPGTGGDSDSGRASDSKP